MAGASCSNVADAAAGAEGVRAAFLVQADACARLGSPFMARLCRLLHERLDDESEIGRFVLGWQGEPGPSHDSVPLRLCGALHAIVLSGRDEQLAGTYPPHETDDTALWSAIEAAFGSQAPFILAWLGSAPQTNEVRRSAALYPGLMVVAQETGLPLRLMELGASGGLNLICDAYGYRFAGKRFGRKEAALLLEPEWRGNRPPDIVDMPVESRLGCDLNPLDVHSAEDRLRMTAYLWPDQFDRLERTRAAIEIARSGAFPFELVAAGALEWLDGRLGEAAPGVARVVMHSIAWQYFPGEVQEGCQRLIEAAGSRADENAPLAWLSMEADGEGEGAALTLRLWPGDRQFVLGRADFHGRWVDWQLPDQPIA